MKINKFEDLEIWKEAIILAKEVYKVTSGSRFSKDYCLKDQIRRAVVSISSNIAEGFEKLNNNEFIRFLQISKGSVGETRSQLYLAKELGYMSDPLFEKLNLELTILTRKITKLIVYLVKKRSNKEFLHKSLS